MHKCKHHKTVLTVTRQLYVTVRYEINSGYTSQLRRGVWYQQVSFQKGDSSESRVPFRLSKGPACPLEGQKWASPPRN